jgi:hypothetical protein
MSALDQADQENPEADREQAKSKTSGQKADESGDHDQYEKKNVVADETPPSKPAIRTEISQINGE